MGIGAYRLSGWELRGRPRPGPWRPLKSPCFYSLKAALLCRGGASNICPAGGQRVISAGFAQIGLGMVSVKQELSMMKPKNVDRDPRKPQKPPPASVPAPVPPLFRKLDWLALAITFGVIWTVYLLTLAPELTLEDSGELVTGAF